MRAWKIVVIPTLLTLAVGAIYLLSVWKHRQNPGVIAEKDASEPVDQDNLVVMRAFFPAHFEDTLRLQETAVWMKDGYAVPYFAYSGAQVEFAHRMGVIPSLQRMEIKKIVKAVVPKKTDDGLEHGDRQAFAVFALPGQKDLFATPIGYMEGNEERYYTDLLFFYDDPHAIYDYWPKNVWAAIDAHQVIQGMSETESRLAVGQKMHGSPGSEGNRTVTYDQDGKKWKVTFVSNRATTIKFG
jgi:hypothetical protein